MEVHYRNERLLEKTADYGVIRYTVSVFIRANDRNLRVSFLIGLSSVHFEKTVYVKNCGYTGSMERIGYV
jgi:hypothetical protein